MEKTFDNLSVGDVLYYAYFGFIDNNLPVYLQKIITIIGEFKVTSVKRITSEKVNISDIFEIPEYIERPCNKIEFTIAPNNENANEIIKRCENTQYANDFKKPIQISLFGENNSTSGRGTLLNLFTSKKLAIEDCIRFVETYTITEDTLNDVIATYKHNNEILSQLKK